MNDGASLKSSGMQKHVIHFYLMKKSIEMEDGCTNSITGGPYMN